MWPNSQGGARHGIAGDERPDQVSPEVRQRVLDAVQRTGYVPNRMAGGLASARSRLIAAVVPSTVMSVFMETIEALNSTLFDAGYQLMLGQSGYSADREELLLEAIIGRRARWHLSHRHHGCRQGAHAPGGLGHSGGGNLGSDPHAHRHAGGFLAP